MDAKDKAFFLDAARRAELAIIAHAAGPVDLRKLFYPDQAYGGRILEPRTLPLDEFVDRDILLAPLVREYLDTRKPFAEVGPFTAAEVEALENEMEMHHGVREPFYIAMSLALQELGRPWQFEEAAGQFLTGFTLGKE